jgi:F like protein
MIDWQDAQAKFLNAEEAATARLVEFYRQARLDLEAYILGGDLTLNDQAFASALLRHVEQQGFVMTRGGAEWINTTIPAAYVEGARTQSRDMSFSAIHDDAVRALSQNSLDLITKTSLDVRMQIQSAIAQGMLQGLSGDALRRQILQSGLTNIPKWPSVEYRAGVIARTETMRAYNSGAFDAIIASDAPAVQWITSPDEATCSRCSPRNGKIYRLPGVGSVEDIEAIAAKWPSAPPLDRKPPLHPRCRCTIRARYPWTADDAPEPTPEATAAEPAKLPPAAGSIDDAIARLKDPELGYAIRDRDLDVTNPATGQPDPRMVAIRDAALKRFDVERAFWRSVDFDEALMLKLGSIGNDPYGAMMLLRYGIRWSIDASRKWTPAMYSELLRSLEAVHSLVPRYVIDSLKIPSFGGATMGTPGGNAIAWWTPYSGIDFADTKFLRYVMGAPLRAGPGVRPGMEVVVHEIGHSVNGRYGLMGYPIEFDPTGTASATDRFAVYEKGSEFRAEWEAVRRKSRGMPVASTDPAGGNADGLRSIIDELQAKGDSYGASFYVKRLKQHEAAAAKVASGKADYYPTSYAKEGGLDEDFAESFMLYVLNPAKLKAQAPNRYEFMRTKIFGGQGGA